MTFQSLIWAGPFPMGVYDLAANTGWVSVGIDHDTSSFAVETIRCWWDSMGSERYPNAERLFITADGGGSNGFRVRLWKVELQKLSDELGMPISVSHFPPGTSKWNKIEHRLFSFISQNWRGKPLISHEVIVNLIASTTTETGLRVRAQLDTAKYPAGRTVSKQELAEIDLGRDSFHANGTTQSSRERKKSLHKLFRDRPLAFEVSRLSAPNWLRRDSSTCSSNWRAPTKSP
ncbi:MAG TPA: ISAzo13 family transposase [Thermoanaerobaculia bacterium]|jgi:hypothetical protein|nr:ISAzo13 family transposase [Thermoanaerobaculia bacterium]